MPNANWTETSDEIRRRWTAGEWTEEIAAELGRSRSAMISRANRIGLGRHPAKLMRRIAMGRSRGGYCRCSAERCEKAVRAFSEEKLLYGLA
jgi:hypothetical protein